MGLISMNMESTILQIPIEDIIPNRFQPRLNFDDEALQELAKSIKEHGIIQPLVLRKLGDKYEIIAGERRYKASQIAGLTTVPAVISNIDDEKSAEVALVENIQRKNLTSIEEAKSYKNILDRGYLTQEQLAEKLGISQSTIANKLRLLNLCDEVQEALLKEKISERHARALLAIKNPTDQVKWLNRIINDRLTVRQLDIEIKKSLKNNQDDEDDSDIPLVELTPNIQEIKENALDIHPQEGLHDIESMLKPSLDTENNEDEIETLDIDDDDVSTEDAPNKFFNYLEDESANMSEEASIDDFSNNTYPNNYVDSDVEELEIDDDYTTTNDSSNSSNDEKILSNDNINYYTSDIDNSNDNTHEDNEIYDNYYNTSQNDNTMEEINNSDDYYEDTSTNDDVVGGKFFNFGNDDNNIDEETTNNEEDNLLSLNNNYDDGEEDTNNDNNLSTDDNEGVIEGKFFNFGNSENNENRFFNSSVDDNSSDDNNENTFFNNSFDSSNENNTIEEINDDYIDTNQNVIEEVEKPKEEVFDPMSMVNTLEDDYEEKIEQEQGTDLTTAISKVRETRDLLESMGFNVTMEEADGDDVYNITININK